MSKTSPVNVAASVRQRLLNLARHRETDFEVLLIHYAIERLLYRLEESSYAGQFVLKGAMLLRAWGGGATRVTRDIDLLGFGESSPDAMVEVFRTTCEIAVVPDDGLTFDATTIQAEEIRDQSEYRGVRVRFNVFLGSARIPVQIDIGFGDVVTPGAASIEYPTLLDHQPPIVRAYSKESVVAEKFHAITALGMANTRMKDFYDLWFVSQSFEFDGGTLGQALRATFERRETVLPLDAEPLALTDDFLLDAAKEAQWRAFLNRTRATDAGNLDLRAVGNRIWGFVRPSLNEGFDSNWPPGGPWK